MVTTSPPVRTAGGQAFSGRISESTPLSSLESGSDQSGFCTSCGALASGSVDTTHGSERKRAFEAGRKLGATTYFQSPVMEQLAMELKLLRTLHDSHCTAAEQRETLLAHWKAEARWWREEHDRVSNEFSGFVKEIARKCGV